MRTKAEINSLLVGLCFEFTRCPDARDKIAAAASVCDWVVGRQGYLTSLLDRIYETGYAIECEDVGAAVSLRDYMLKLLAKLDKDAELSGNYTPKGTI